MDTNWEYPENGNEELMENIATLPPPTDDETDVYDTSPGEEVPELRDSSTKVYSLGNHRFQAITFGQAVHYQAEDGTWQDIDNTLELDTEDHMPVLRTRANKVKMTLAQNTKRDKLVSFEYKGKRFGWQFEGDLASVAAQVTQPEAIHSRQMLSALSTENRDIVKQKTIDASARRDGEDASSLALNKGELLTPAQDLMDGMLSKQQLRMITGEKNAVVEYPQLLPDVDVKYTLLGDRLKEDIILKDADAARRGVCLKLRDEDVTYRLGDDQSISVLDAQTDEPICMFAKPFAYDSSAEMDIRPVHVSLEREADGMRMRYKLDDAFIDAATYPITIDPVVIPHETTSNVEDTFVSENMPSTNYGGSYMLKTGVGESSGKNITYIRTKKLVKQTAGDTIIYAGLYLVSLNGTSGYVGCYPVTSAWTENGVKYSNKPTTGSIVDYSLSSKRDMAIFDITNLYRSWYKKDSAGASTNLGVALMRPSGETASAYREFGSVNPSSTLGLRIVVNYVSCAGLEGWFDYEGMSAGRAGTANTSLFNGNMVFEHTDTASGGSRMPVSISHYYNSCRSTKNEVYCGKGWRLSAHLTLHCENIKQDSKTVMYYVLTGGSGTQTYFNSTNSTIKDESGKELTLTISGNNVLITSKMDMQLTFPKPTNTTRQHITQAKDGNGNIVTYTYTGGKLTRITDGAGRNTDLTYNSAGWLAKVTPPDGYAVSYTYSGEALASVTYADGVVTNFGYTDGLLSSAATNQSADSLTLTYETAGSYDSAAIDGYEHNARRVLIMERKFNGNAMEKLLFNYLTMATEVTMVTSTSSDTGKKLIYQFNDSGNCKSVYDELGNAHFTKYDSSRPNTANSVSRLQRVVINRVADILFERTDAWTKSLTGGTATVDTAAGNRCLNAQSLKITKTAAGDAIYKQSVTVEKGMSWTFSAYAKLSGTYKAFVRITGKNAAGANITNKSAELTAESALPSGAPGTTGFVRLQATIDLPSDASSGAVTVELIVSDASGTVWFCCPQLESGKIANRPNLLENAGFHIVDADNRPATWNVSVDLSSGDVCTTDASKLGKAKTILGATRAMKLSGSPTTVSYSLNRDMEISGNKGDVFTAGGWCNARAASSRNKSGEASRLAIGLRFYVNGAWSDYTFGSFNREWVGWQFGAFAYTAPDKYTKVRLKFEYEHNINEVYFTHLFMNREEFGESYARDAKGNIVTATTLSGKQEKMKYDSNNNLTSYTQPGAAEADAYTFKYGTAANAKHNLLESATPLKVRAKYEYDSAGNVIKTTNIGPADTDPKIVSSATYTANKNAVADSTNAMGGKTTFTIDQAKDLMTAQTDPVGKRVDYAYDNRKRITSATSTAKNQAGATLTYKNEYAYNTKDRMTSIKHNGTTYSFDYDALGRVSATKVGAQALATNTYSADRRSLLTKVTYGNGQYAENVYDAFGRLTSYKIGGTEQAQYEYGANGQLAFERDLAAKSERYYDYDLTEKLCGVRTVDSASKAIRHAYIAAYNSLNQQSQLTESVKGGIVAKTVYTYDKDNRLTKEALATTGFTARNTAYTYDALGRLTSKLITVGNLTLETAYTYLAGPNSTTTGMISQLVNTTKLSGVVKYTQTLKYTYDLRGHIKTVTDTANGKTYTSNYTYDALGQLMREDNQSIGRTFLYDYDAGGNLLFRKMFGFTLGTPGAQEYAYTYAYGNATWKDQMTAADGTALEYDQIGNLKRNASWSFTWEGGRRLAKMTFNSGGSTIAYKYDKDGIRTSKTVGTVTTNYLTSGGRLVLLENTSTLETGYIQYDAQGRPVSIRYKKGSAAYETFYYILNQQGDVTALVDANGLVVVNYIYSAAGNFWGCDGSRYLDLGMFNPLRYRGYIYDGETGLYYLQSRYYHPAWQRFISADSILGRVGGILEHNLYAYCCNNPVMHSDPTGLFHGIIRDGELLVKANGQLTEAGHKRKKRSYLSARDILYQYIFASVFRDYGQGWYSVIDKQVTGTNRRHIHVRNDRLGVEYSQNDDGSPHDNSTGSPPNWVKKKIKSTGWDWDDKAKKHDDTIRRFLRGELIYNDWDDVYLERDTKEIPDTGHFIFFDPVFYPSPVFGPMPVPAF